MYENFIASTCTKPKIETGMIINTDSTLYKLFTVLSVFIFLTPIISADDWDVHQNNFQISHDSYHVRVRDYYGKDLTHLQLGWAASSRLNLQYQYWSGNGQVEHRPRFDFRFGSISWDDHKFSIGIRPEFRLFQSEENYIRPWIRLGYKYEKFNLSVNPRFAFGKTGVSTAYWEDTQVIFHYDVPINDRITIQPGFWFLTEGSSDVGKKKSLYSAIQFNYKL